MHSLNTMRYLNDQEAERGTTAPAPAPVGIRDILEALAGNAQREYEEETAQAYLDALNERQRMIDMDDEFYVPEPAWDEPAEQAPLVENFETHDQTFQIRTVNSPRFGASMPIALQRSFENVGDLLAAVYIEGMRFAEEGVLESYEVEDYAQHLAHQMTIVVIDEVSVTQRTTVL